MNTGEDSMESRGRTDMCFVLFSLSRGVVLVIVVPVHPVADSLLFAS